MKTVAILHYASPPTVGGVEWTIFYHARVLTELGYTVKVVSGSGASFDPRIETIVEPLFGSKHPDVLTVKKELDQGQISAAFESLVEHQQAALHRSMGDCDVCIVHNVPTLNKNLPLTTALHSYNATNPIKLVAWCHDLAWTNPQYIPELHQGHPWELLRQRWDDTTYVTVSEPRRGEVADLLNMPPDEVHVVVPGVDPAEFYHWTPTTTMLQERLRLLDADGLLLIPARLTRRKNIGLGLRVLAAIRAQSGQDFRLIVTGPPGPHNPTNPGYLGELLAIRDELGLGEAAHFLYAYGEGEEALIPDNATMANMYHLADMLFFPSTQEGFGIPMLEAGFAGMPIFCSDIPPFRVTGGEQANYFDPVDDPPETIASRILAYLKESPTYHMRVRTRKTYRWDSIVREQVLPLL